MIAVEAAGPIRPQEGTRTYQRHGQQVTVTQAPGTVAGAEVTLAQAVTLMLTPPGDEVPLAAGTTAGMLAVPTVDDRRVDPTETFTMMGRLPADPLIEGTEATAEGRIKDDDTERARRRSLGMVLAGVGRTLATDAVDVIGARFIRQPLSNQVR